MIDDQKKKLAKAKRMREKMLEEYARMLNACACLWPIRKNRNGSGHSDDCPAHKLWEEDREALED
jgi:hypothetical protein